MTSTIALPVGFANLVGAMPADRRSLGDRILAQLEEELRKKGGGLGIAVEADDAAIRKILDPEVYWVRHRDERDLDGVLLFGTREVCTAGKGTWHPGAPSSPVNAPRPILTAPIRVRAWPSAEHSFVAAAMHRPKPQGGEVAGRTMDRHAHAVRADVIGTDGNLRHEAMQSRYRDYVIRSREVVHLMGRKHHVELGTVKGIDALRGTGADDHPILLGSVKPGRR